MTQYADFTYLSTLLRCPLQWHYRYRLGLEPIDSGGQVPLKAGKLGHAVLEAFYRGGPWEQTLSEGYATSGIVAIGRYDYMTQGHMEVMLHKYAETYAQDRSLRVASFIEQPLASEGLQIGGIPDMIVEGEDGELVVWDHKFTTSWLANLEARLELSMQLPIYCLLASEHTGRPVKRAVLNMIHMGPGASNPKSKAERFSRRIYNYSDWQLGQARMWIANTQALVENLVVAPRAADQHCSYCEFRELCLARSQTVQAALIATSFKKRSITGTLLSGADMEVEG